MPTARDGVGMVAFAVELADHLGLERVSIRLVADRAGIPVYRLYRQIRSHSDLLSAMAEYVIRQHAPGDVAPPSDPRAQLEQLARHEWAMYRRHPWLLTVLATTRPPISPALLAMVDRVVSALTDAGIDPADAYRVYLVFSGYIQGMAMLIEPGPVGADYYDDWRRRSSEQLEHSGSLRQRPWLAAASQTAPRTDLDNWFEFGLHSMLDGLLP
jgi:AcrR family transcriptional regulator